MTKEFCIDYTPKEIYGEKYFVAKINDNGNIVSTEIPFGEPYNFVLLMENLGYKEVWYYDYWVNEVRNAENKVLAEEQIVRDLKRGLDSRKQNLEEKKKNLCNWWNDDIKS